MDPYLKEERRAMKRHKDYCNMLGYVADGQYGIPTRCPCGGSIVDEVAANEAFDNLPGKRCFTCRDYKEDGLHYRQHWVLGVEEEFKKLTRRVAEAEKLTSKVYGLNAEIQKLKDEVEKLTRRVGELEMVL